MSNIIDFGNGNFAVKVVGVTATGDASNAVSVVGVNTSGNAVYPGAIDVKTYGATGNGTTDDTAAIQVAINAVIGQGGGKVLLPIGTYKVTAPLVIPEDGITLEGAGAGFWGTNVSPAVAVSGTIIKAGTGFSGSAVVKVQQTGTPTRALFGNVVRDLTIDANGLCTYALLWQSQHGHVERVRAVRGTSHGIYVPSVAFAYPGAVYDTWFSEIKCEFNGGYGLYFDQYSSDCMVIDAICNANTLGGIGGASGTGGTMIVNPYIYGGSGGRTGKAITWVDPYHLTITGGRLMDTDGGIYLSGSGGGAVHVSDIIIRNASVTTDNTTDGINVNMTGLVYGWVFSGIEFHSDAGVLNAAGNKMRYGINLTSGFCVGATIAGCASGFNSPATATFGTAAILDAATGTQIIGAPPSAGNVASRLVGTGTSSAQAILYHLNNSGGPLPQLLTRGGRGTIIDPRRTRQFDRIQRIGAGGYYAADDSTTATESTEQAAIDIYAMDAFTSTGRGTAIDFLTTASGATGMTTQWRIGPNGDLAAQTAARRVVFSEGPVIRAGSGTPEGVVTAPVGSLYLRSDGGAGTSHYVKESGSGSTGWVQK